MWRLMRAVQGLVRPLLAAAASEGPGDTPASSNSETTGASNSPGHQRCMLQAIQLAVLLLFQVQVLALKHVPWSCTALLCCD